MCTVEGCDRYRKYRLYCGMHQNRMRKTGSLTFQRRRGVCICGAATAALEQCRNCRQREKYRSDSDYREARRRRWREWSKRPEVKARLREYDAQTWRVNNRKRYLKTENGKLFYLNVSHMRRAQSADSDVKMKFVLYLKKHTAFCEVCADLPMQSPQIDHVIPLCAGGRHLQRISGSFAAVAMPRGGITGWTRRIGLRS